MDKIIKTIKEHSLLVQILIATIALLIISASTSLILYYEASSDEIISVHRQNLEDTSRLIENQMLQRLRLITQSVFAFGTNRTITAKLDAYLNDYGIQNYIELNSEIIDYLNQLYIELQDLIDSAAYFADNRIFYNYHNVLRPNLDYQAIDKSFDFDGFSAIFDEMENPIFFSETTVVPIVFRFPYSKTNTYIIIFLSTAKIANTMSSFYLSYFDEMEIVRKDGSIIYTTSPDFLRENVNQRNRFTRIDDRDYLIFDSHAWMEDWTIYLAKESTETIERINGLRTFQIILIVFESILCTIILYLIYRGFMRPLDRLVKLMKTNSDNLVYSKVSYTKDNEIGTVGRYYNSMIEEIETLIKSLEDKIEQLEEEKAQKEWERGEKRKAEIKALQAQINPHFLYNALNAIVWIATENNDNEAATFSLRLGDYYRTNLSDGKEFISLKEELKHAENYLWIQQKRYDEISYSLNADESVLDTMVPKIIIEPLIENSIYHGIKPKGGKGNISISIEKGEKDILITVVDDGLGIQKETLETIRQALYDGIIDSESGYGIYNVNSRIKMTYGKDYGLSLESIEHKWTKAVLRLPQGGNT